MHVPGFVIYSGKIENQFHLHRPTDRTSSLSHLG